MKSATPSEYNYRIVQQFTLATIVWGIIGMSIGALLAAQLVWPSLNFDLPWTSFGRIRPAHTNFMIFAFGANALFASSLYVVQRTCYIALPNPNLARLFFWAWQGLIIVMGASYALGITSSKEYAEFEWPIALAMVILWIIYAYLYFYCLVRRNIKHIYVANWFYAAFIIVTAMIIIVNKAAMPYSLWHSYSVYSGATDAMIQWWYGHSVVGFILSVAFLGMMYYFVPKQVEQPVYSYRISIVHFWAIITIYIWAGPHHLHYTALPDWAQSVGMAMSIILLAPSWGGMINGMMTLSGAWYKLRSDPILRFMVVSLAFYGMSTFEGPMMAIKTVNALSHYTDWTIGHVHAGALGWVAMMTIGTLYYLIPRLWGQSKMYSENLISLHFWLATIGTVMYIAAMWVNGISQGLMWRAVNKDGTLTYSFVEALQASHYGYIVRFIGGSLFTIGMILLGINALLTIHQSQYQAKLEAQYV